MSARRRLQTAASALILAVGLAACGQEAHPKVADANNNGGYVDAGPVTYQLQISRLLNPYSTEDAQYIKGLPVGTTAPTAQQTWYGVFLWAKNQTNRDQVTTDNFVVTDTQGAHYHPVKLDPNINPYAWTSQVLQPLGIEPGPDTTASSGPTQGKLVLFKINTSAYSNRPLTLEILGSSNQQLATISLGL
ncbi:MAG: hypothetical protein ACRDNK_05940 [Solirubrobacteraceae bacterium]